MAGISLLISVVECRVWNTKYVRTYLKEFMSERSASQYLQRSGGAKAFDIESRLVYRQELGTLWELMLEEKLVNDDQMYRSIQSIGMGCFVKYFEAFSDLEKSNEDLIEALMKLEGYEESGAKTRVSSARRILREGRAVDALTKIEESERTESWVVAKAKYLLEETQAK